ncbi:MAG: hypothetical protein KME09_16570 [Pleurocapsa minor HA4230-MV1]|jgi:hypothetical protein|nr:hypothetical protein [Pleurocapsa minor HA4230-MV1]
MVLNKLKQIRDELKNSADTYDTAFKNTALMAADELVKEEKQLKQLKSNQHLLNLNPSLDKQYFIDKYGSLKNAKVAYQKIHGEQQYGRSWSDFLTVAQKLSSPEQPALTLEERITKMENFLSSFGYQP